MALIEIKSNPSPLERRLFGLLCAAFFGVLGALVHWKGGSARVAAGLWVFGAAVALAYYVVPGLRWPIYIVWMRAAFPIGWVVSHVLFAVIYYAVLTPMGVAMQLLGQDPMQRRRRAGEKTYWTKLEPPPAKSRYFRQS